MSAPNKVAFPLLPVSTLLQRPGAIKGRKKHSLEEAVGETTIGSLPTQVSLDAVATCCRFS